MNKKYSVVATTYNNENEIVDYLKNIEQQTFLPTEVIIVDGGSKDKTVELLNEYKCSSCLNIKVIWGEILNISQGYNAAIKAANYELIGITGIGNLYENDFFEKLYLKLATDELDYVSGFLFGQEHTDFNLLYNKIYLNFPIGVSSARAENHGVLVRKYVFEELGFFYENFVYAGEDAEFFRLAELRGYRSAVETQAKVYWDTPHSFKELTKQTKNYTIGAMQINSNKYLFKIWKRRLLILFFGILTFEMLFFNMTRIIAIILISTVIVWAVFKVIKFGIKGFSLRIVQEYLPLFYIIRFSKYLNKKCKVNRELK